MNRRRLLTVMLCVAICFAALFSLSACGGDNGKALSVAKSHFENGSDFYKIVYEKGEDYFSVSSNKGIDGAILKDGEILLTLSDGSKINLGEVISPNKKSVFEIYKEKYGFQGTEADWYSAAVSGRLDYGMIFVVNFDSDGGSNCESVEVIKGGKIPQPQTPTKTGYDLVGWYNGEEKWIFSDYTVTSNLTLKAKWQIKKVVISFDSAGGSEIKDITADYGSFVTLPEPKRTDYEFLGWYVGDLPVGGVTIAVSGDAHLTAKWRSVFVTVTFDSEGGRDVAPQTIRRGSAVEMPVPYRAGHRFLGWYNEDQKIEGEFSTYEDVTLFAKWEQIPVNPAANYNYYSYKYSIEGPINILPITYNTLESMLTTTGRYLVYVDSEDYGAAARFAFVNQKANEWGVTVHHFNPVLSGGFASDDSSAVENNVFRVLSDNRTANGGLGIIQSHLSEIFGFDVAQQGLDHMLLAIKGAPATPQIIDSSAVPPVIKPKYNTQTSVVNYASFDDAVKLLAIKKPVVSGGSDVGDGTVDYDTSNINAFNIYGDKRFHIYSSAEDKFFDEKTDVYQTVANYAQLEYLMTHNKGYFAVMFGGVWCPNTTAATRLSDYLARKYSIEAIYMFDFRLDGGTKTDSYYLDGSGNVIVSENGNYLANSMLTRNNDAVTESAYNFNYLYANFIDTFMPDYQSGWNSMVVNITTNGIQKAYSRLCTPGLFLFDGSGDAPRLVASFEAEYYYDDMVNEDSVQFDAWNDAVTELFAKNPYGWENIDVVWEHDDDYAPHGSASAPAADAGGC